MGKVRLGMLTPSSNTVVEPLSTAIVAGLEEVSVHFSRFRVTEINLGERASAQFALEPILEAARLLADAKVDVICWNGTSAAWLGFERDRKLCRAILNETGVRATSSILALNEALAVLAARKVGLLTPYLHEVQRRIVETYAAIGIDCANERHFGDPGNFSFALIEEERVRTAAAELAEAKLDALAIVCTNLPAAPLVAELEARHGAIVLDSLAVAVWHSLVLAGVDTARVQGWGRLFKELRPSS